MQLPTMRYWQDYEKTIPATEPDSPVVAIEFVEHNITIEHPRMERLTLAQVLASNQLVLGMYVASQH